MLFLTYRAPCYQSSKDRVQRDSVFTYLQRPAAQDKNAETFSRLHGSYATGARCPRNERMFVETPLGDWLMPPNRASAFFLRPVSVRFFSICTKTGRRGMACSATTLVTSI